MKFIDKRVLEESVEENSQNDNIIENNNQSVNNDGELEFNKRNREDFEKLMKESSTNLDGYWDKNNPFVKIILLILGVLIIAGAIFYITAYLNK